MEHANLSPTCQISPYNAIVQITITSSSQSELAPSHAATNDALRHLGRNVPGRCHDFSALAD